MVGKGVGGGEEGETWKEQGMIGRRKRKEQEEGRVDEDEGGGLEWKWGGRRKQRRLRLGGWRIKFRKGKI